MVLSQSIQGPVLGDLAYPCREALWSPQLVQPLGEAKQHLLHHIFPVTRDDSVDDPPDYRADQLPRDAQESFLRPTVPLSHSLYQLTADVTY